MVLRIAEKIVNALKNNKNFRSGIRDNVITSIETTKYYLYDTLLIEIINNSIINITPNNYYTNTTRNRLNQIVELLTNNKYNIRIIKSCYYLFKDGEKLDEIKDKITLYI